MVFKIVVTLVKPNGVKEEVCRVDKLTDVPRRLDDIKYDGTWLTPTRKLLRYGRGELFITEEIMPPHIAASRIIVNGSKLIHELLIANHPRFKTICMTNDHWVGYNCLYNEIVGPSSIIFQARNYTRLADPDCADKDLAYSCFEYYERFMSEQNQVQQAM